VVHQAVVGYLLLGFTVGALLLAQGAVAPAL
jgi:hypothetical protein